MKNFDLMIIIQNLEKKINEKNENTLMKIRKKFMELLH